MTGRGTSRRGVSGLPIARHDDRAAAGDVARGPGSHGRLSWSVWCGRQLAPASGRN